MTKVILLDGGAIQFRAIFNYRSMCVSEILKIIGHPDSKEENIILLAQEILATLDLKLNNLCEILSTNEDIIKRDLYIVEEELLTMRRIPVVYTFLRMVIGYLKILKVTFEDSIILCHDYSSWRKAEDKTYKAQRLEQKKAKGADEWWKGKYAEFKIIYDILDKYSHIKCIKIYLREADDIISCACRHYKDKEVIIISSDGDIEQLAIFCVSPDTEILTLHGWKKYNELKKPQRVASYNKETQKIEYSNLTKLHIFQYKGEMIHIKNKSLDILSTPNHINIIKYKTAIKGNFIYKPLERKSENLKKNDLICVNGNDFEYKIKYSVGVIWAELIGWFISEGYFINKNQKAVGITQSLTNFNKIKRIETLLSLTNILYSKYVGKSKKKYNGAVTFYIRKCPFVDWIYENIPLKELNEKLISLPLIELDALFLGLMEGDGCKRNGKYVVFTQKNKNTVHWFEILAMKLGYHTNTRKYKNINAVYLCKKKYIGIRNAKISKEDYNGVVWCPTTKNGTWIAKRNGKVFITGNSNVKIFSPVSKRFKDIPNPAKSLLDKMQKDISDNLLTAPSSEAEFEKRRKIVDLTRLPEEIERPIFETLEKLMPKSLNLHKMPFNSVRTELKKLYNLT